MDDSGADIRFVVTNFLFYSNTFVAIREIAKELCEAKHEKEIHPFLLEIKVKILQSNC